MRKEHVLVVLVAVFVTLVTLAPLTYMAYRHMPRAIVTVDLQKLIEEEEKHAVALLSKDANVSTEQRQVVEKLTVDFAKKLSANMDTLGAECHCVIINKAALLGGTTVDYTDVMRERIRREP